MKTIKAIINCMLIGMFFLTINVHAQDSECVIYTLNYDFEEPALPPGAVWPSFEDQDDVPGWQTTASDGVIEVWPSTVNGGGHTAYSGNQYIELNANEVSGIYQDYSTPISGIVFNYSFAHAARDQVSSGSDVVGVYAGPTDIPLNDLTLIGTYSSEVQTGWHLKTGSYTVPSGQTTTRFLFKAVSTASPDSTVGNYLDAIQFTASFGIVTPNLTISCTDAVEVEALGTGQWGPGSSNPSPAVIDDDLSATTTISGMYNPGVYSFTWYSYEDVGGVPTPICQDEILITVIDGSIPINTVLASLPSKCDEDGDGTESFDLTQAEATFVDNPGDYDIDYYESQNTAENEDSAGAIGTPEDYELQTGNTKTVFLRISSGECYDVVALNIAVYAIPDVIDVIDLNTCEDNAGEFKLDLTQNTANIIGNQNPANISVTYYDNQPDAENGEVANAIPTPENFQLAGVGCETIYARVENSHQEACYQVVAFQACGIEVNSGTPNDLEACTVSSDGLANFNLTQNNDAVLNGEDASQYIINYFTSMADADNNQNEIQTPENYKAETVSQTIYVRIENSQNPSCYATESFSISSIQVVAEPIEELKVCGVDAFNNYDLTEVEAMLNLGQGQHIEGYFTSLEEAGAQENAISTPEDYTNTTENEAIYILVSNPNEPCFEVYQTLLKTETCEVAMPKGFSPNGDGYNDVFEIPGLIENYPNFTLEIYSRYGRKVFKGNSKTGYWDGNSDGGGEAPTGTYFYMLNLHSDKEIIKGWVYLNR